MSDTVHTALDAKDFGGVKGEITDQMALKQSTDHAWFY